MLCVNAPRKPMARIHLLVSLVLVIICTVLAFTPLMKIVVTQETQDQITNLMEYVLNKMSDDGEDSAAAKERIRKIVDSMQLEDASVPISYTRLAAASQPLTDASAAMTEMITAAMNASSGEDSEEKAKAALEKMKNAFLTEDGNAIKPEVRDLVVVLAAVVGPMLPSGEDIESGMSEDDIPDLVAKAIPNLIGLFVAVILSVLIPVIYAVLALVTVITALKNLKEPDIGAAKLAKRMPKSIVHPLTVMLVPCLSATIQTTTSTLLLAILAAVGTLVNVVFTRLHSWEKKDLAYANVVQFTTIASIAAYVFLFLNILKMGVFSSFIGKTMGSAVGSGSSSAPAGMAKDAGMIVIAVLFALLSLRYLAKVGRRISLACTPKKKGGARATHLVYALFTLLITVFPMMALGGTNLSVSLAQEYALFYGFIASCVMVLSEIVLLILRKVFGKDLTPAAVADVLSGVSLGPDTAAAPAEETAPVETAAEEASAEEAPAEEVAAEVAAEDVAETPAEEEAPIEEARADETGDEQKD